MKRGLCCLCAVLLCTALVAAGPEPAKDTGPEVMAKPERAAERPLSISAPKDDAAHTVAGPVQAELAPVGRVPDRTRFTVSQKAPPGYEGAPIRLGPRGCDPAICWMGGTPEGEPVCYDGYVDNYNAGCNSEPPSWNSTITCGQTICGTSGVYDDATYRDTDWFVFVATQDTQFTFTVRADFPVVIGLVETNPLGSGDCADMTGFLNPAVVGDPCQEISVTKCVPPGTYWLFVSTNGWPPEVECGAEYEATLTCVPCEYLWAPECPGDTLDGQRPYGQDEPWVAFVSNSKFYDWTEGIKRLESFFGVSAANGIERVTWWGLSAVYDDWGFLVECPLEPGTFLIEVWPHDPMTNRPPPELLPGLEICSYTLTAPQLTKSDSGHMYGPYTLWQWDATLPTPCYVDHGWLAIQNTDYCFFWLAASPEGGTVHLMVDERDGNLAWEVAQEDTAYCLRGTYTEITGACCDAYEAYPPSCLNTTLDNCYGFGKFFYQGVTCAQINWCQDIFDEAACCDAQGNCFGDTSYWFCLHEGGTWWEDESCLEWPFFDCPPVGDYEPIECDPDRVFGQNLSGPNWLFPSWVENNDYRWVDNYQYTGAAIRRVHFWGIGTLGWGSGNWSNCDFDGGPFNVRVKFYETDPGGTLPPPAPKYYDPLCSYDTIATVAQTQYWFASIGLYIYRFTVVLPTPCALSNGWYSVQQILGGGQCRLGTLSGVNGDNRAFQCDSAGCEEWIPLPDQPPADTGFCLYTTVPVGACCDVRDGSCADNVPQDQCVQAYHKFFGVMNCAQVDQYNFCEPVPGACCDLVTGECEITYGYECTGPDQEWLGPNSTCDACCVAACPAGGTPEGEPICGPGYEDTYNPGCLSIPPIFQPLAPGVYLCGEAGNYEYSPDVWYRDTDWFEFDVPGLTGIKWNVKAEFIQHTMILGDCAAAGMPRGDANCDGKVDGFDIAPFVMALTNPVQWEATYPDCNILCVADINCDGNVDGFDIAPFVECLTVGCPPCDTCGPTYQWGQDGFPGYCAGAAGAARAILTGDGANWGFVSNYYEAGKDGYDYYPPCGTPYVAWYDFFGAGACEFPDDTCILASQYVCWALGGDYQGDGIDCPE